MISALYFFDEVFEELTKTAREMQNGATDELTKKQVLGYCFTIKTIVDIAEDCDLLHDLPYHMIRSIHKFLAVFQTKLQLTVKLSDPVIPSNDVDMDPGISALVFIEIVLEQLIKKTRALQRKATDELAQEEVIGYSFAIDSLLSIAEGCDLLDDLPEYVRDIVPESLMEFEEISEQQ